MVVGICTFEIFIPHADSLKAKRKVLQSLLARTRSRHNVSAAEVEHQDLWQRAGIAIAAVGTSRQHIQTMFEGILNGIETTLPAQVVSRRIEFL